MVKETHSKVLRLITDLHREDREKHIDDMTTKGQTPNQTLNSAKIPDFYTLPKIRKPTLSTITEGLIISAAMGKRRQTFSRRYRCAVCHPLQCYKFSTTSRTVLQIRSHITTIEGAFERQKHVTFSALYGR